MIIYLPIIITLFLLCSCLGIYLESMQVVEKVVFSN
jgi:hypothetical protein